MQYFILVMWNKQFLLFNLVKIFTLVVFVSLSSACTLLLMNERFSHSHYTSPSESYRCKLPGGILSSQLEVHERSNEIGETVSFSHKSGLYWRIDHLRIGSHKIAMLDETISRRERLEQAKLNYYRYHLEENVELAEIKWEQYTKENGEEVLVLYNYLKWKDAEENRELVFSIDEEYLNVVHHTQNVSDKIHKVTTNALDLYKSCVFFNNYTSASLR